MGASVQHVDKNVLSDERQITRYLRVEIVGKFCVAHWETVDYSKTAIKDALENFNASQELSHCVQKHATI